MKKNNAIKLLFITGLCFVMSFKLHAQINDDAAIRAVMNEQVKAWNKGDIDTFMQTYWKSDSLLFVGSKGPAYGWQTTLNNYKKGYLDTIAMGKLDFNILEVKLLSADYGFVLGKWHLTRTIGDIGGYFTLLFRKINGHWYIVADHTS
ncbi:nuclear transport factor 2 family protein [soil metagenome]